MLGIVISILSLSVCALGVPQIISFVVKLVYRNKMEDKEEAMKAKHLNATLGSFVKSLICVAILALSIAALILVIIGQLN